MSDTLVTRPRSVATWNGPANRLMFQAIVPQSIQPFT